MLLYRQLHERLWKVRMSKQCEPRARAGRAHHAAPWAQGPGPHLIFRRGGRASGPTIRQGLWTGDPAWAERSKAPEYPSPCPAHGPGAYLGALASQVRAFDRLWPQRPSTCSCRLGAGQARVTARKKGAESSGSADFSRAVPIPTSPAPPRPGRRSRAGWARMHGLTCSLPRSTGTDPDSPVLAPTGVTCATRAPRLFHGRGGRRSRAVGRQGAGRVAHNEAIKGSAGGTLTARQPSPHSSNLIAPFSSSRANEQRRIGSRAEGKANSKISRRPGERA